jgi:peptidoglycan/LPS O-acetylase OafA/YrhL
VSVVHRPFRADIQGLRAVAVGLVVLNHAATGWAPGGFVGVDVFFVISGFLISGHLVEGLHRTGGIGFLAFYAARARRILPAALATILATAVAAFFLVSPLRIVDIVHDGIASALFVPNLVFAARRTDYLAGTAPSPFQHFWSLGVEEQFYLVWPVLLLAAFLVGRRSHGALVVAIGAVTAASFLASVLSTPADPSIAFFSPHTRAWEFGAGALVAASTASLARVPAVAARVLCWLGLGAILAAVVAYGPAVDYPGSAALLPVVGAVLVVAFGDRGGRVLTRRPLPFIGMISYSLYLVHWPLLVLVHERIGLDEPLPAPVGLALAAASVPLAWVLYRVVERPFRARRGVERATGAGSDGSGSVGSGSVGSGSGGSGTVGSGSGGSGSVGSGTVGSTRSARRVVLAAAGVTLVLVSGLLAGSVAARELPLASERVGTERAASELPVGTPFVPANVAPALDAAVADTGEIYTDGCQQNPRESAVLTCAFGDLDSERTIALFGDSHAGRWFPALEEAATSLGFRLDTYTKSGCRSEETVKAWSASKNRSCASWREAVVDRLHTDPPDVIVLGNHVGPTPGKDPSSQLAEWTEGLTRLYDRLPQSSLVVTLADTPEFSSSPVLCLSTHLEDADGCSAPRELALNPAIREAQRKAAAAHDGVVIDMTDYLCNVTTCPAVIGTVLVYSDEHHLTATFSRTLAPILEQRLEPALSGLP